MDWVLMLIAWLVFAGWVAYAFSLVANINNDDDDE